jgi:hypothetical protein
VTGPIKAHDVEAERVSWLWHNRIPKGMITVVAGRPDQGKGLFAARVAADVSAAGGKVLYSAAEDSHGLMTRPRLEAAGANLDNVLLWRFALPLNGKELGQIVTDCRTTKEIAAGLPPVKVDLVVMDPFASHLSGGISRHSDNVRQVLGPLTKLIESTGTAVLIIEHALKRISKGGDPLQAIGGSGSGLPAAARAAYVFGVDPDDEERRIMAKAKFNIGPSPKAMAFEVDTELLDVVGEVPFLSVDEELMAFDAMRLFDTKNQPNKVGRPPDKRSAAAEWLTKYLAEAAKPVPAGTVQEDAKHYGMTAKTLRRAADDMGIVKDPPGGGRGCTWDLPKDLKELMGIEVAVTEAEPVEQIVGQYVENAELVEDFEAAVGDIDAGFAALLGGDDEEDDDA